MRRQLSEWTVIQACTILCQARGPELPVGAVLAAILFVAMMAFMVTLMKRFKRCPPGKVLVVSGRTGLPPGDANRYLRQGAVFVFPLFQTSGTLHAAPFEASAELDAQTSDGMGLRGQVRAQAALGDARQIPIDGHDALEMDGLLVRIVLAENFELRVIDDQAAVRILDFAVNDHFLAGGDEFVDEGHIEPAAGDFAGAEDAARAVHDHGLEKSAVWSEMASG